MMMKKSKKAVALKYDGKKDAAPVVVAKGRAEIAERIIALAKESRIPLYEDKNLVQVLEKLDLNSEIPSELYHAVAEVLVFIYGLNKNAR